MIEFDRLHAAAFKAERAAARRLAVSDAISPHEALRITLEGVAKPSTLAALLDAREANIAANALRRQERDQRKADALARKLARHDGAPTPWRAWFDGSAHPNPGRCGIGALLKGPAGELVEISRAAGHGNSSEAEYQALIAVLQAAVQHGARGLTVYGDSRVVIDDVNGPLSAGAISLLPHRLAAHALLAQVGKVALRWIPRAKNAEADTLSQRAIAPEA